MSKECKGVSEGKAMPIDNVTWTNCRRCGHRYADHIKKCPRCSVKRYSIGGRTYGRHRKSIFFALFLGVSLYALSLLNNFAPPLIQVGNLGDRVSANFANQGLLIIINLVVLIVDLLMTMYFLRRLVKLLRSGYSRTSKFFE